MTFNPEMLTCLMCHNSEAYSVKFHQNLTKNKIRRAMTITSFFRNGDLDFGSLKRELVPGILVM